MGNIISDLKKHTNNKYVSFCAFARDKRTVCCVASSVITLVICYAYGMLNNINNYDAVFCSPEGTGGVLPFGRWFSSILYQYIIGEFGFLFNTSFFSIMLVGIILTLASILICKALKLKSICSYIFIPGVTISFPAITSATLFYFNSYLHAFAILMICTATYLLSKKVNAINTIISVLLYSFAAGIYQGYYPFAIVLLVLVSISKLFDCEIKTKKILFNGVIYAFSIGISVVTYRIFLNICLKIYGMTLSNYQGVSNMGQIDFAKIPSIVKNVYYNYILLFNHEFDVISKGLFIRLLLLLVMTLSAVLLLMCIRKIKLDKFILLLILSVAVLPLASNFIYIMVPNGTVYTIMMLGLVSVFYFPILMVEKTEINSKRFFKTILSVLLTLVVVNYSYMANGCYKVIQYRNIQTENYYSVMLARIQSTDGYDDKKQIVFYGELINDENYHDVWTDTKFAQYGGVVQFDSNSSEQINEYSRSKFFENYFGYSVREMTDNEIEKNKDVIDNLSCYPDSGSIAVADDLVIVRFE